MYTQHGKNKPYMYLYTSMKKIALSKVLGLKTVAKKYLGPCQTSMMKPCENSEIFTC